MNRKILEQYLATAEDHIRTGRQRVARQCEVVARIRANGGNARMAEGLLEQFRHSLESFETDRQLFLQLLELTSKGERASLYSGNGCEPSSDTRGAN